ncbi:MAG TPA: nuclear transport factor 2 family protein [Pseudonocardiaceae bacterium]|jgi:hypothetical protein|nr:nuclear transport factor 2 family protein [Pseudonocardiaceae bacterium]
MNLAGYLRYVAAFNSQDWDLVHHEFYAEDVSVRFPIARLSGAAESLAWFRTAHEALFEVLAPMRIDLAEDGREIVADLAVRFIALGDTDFAPGRSPAHAGDVADVPMRATYRFDADDRITRLDVIFTGPPVQGRISRGPGRTSSQPPETSSQPPAESCERVRAAGSRSLRQP